MKQGMRHHSSSITINYALALATMTKPDYFLIGTSLPTGICRAKTGGMDGRISIPRIARLYFSSDGERRHGLISFAKPGVRMAIFRSNKPCCFSGVSEQIK
jgi:hypothetical protein